MHLNTKLIFHKYALDLFSPGMRVLEVGPITIPTTFQKAVNNPSIIWETLDIKNTPGLTYHAIHEYKYPISDNRFDIVLSSNVVEHIPKVWIWYKELARICKVGGKVVTVSSLNYDIHGKVDCWRILPQGMCVLYEESGLEVDLCKWEVLDDTLMKGSGVASIDMITSGTCRGKK